jgi:hypothetical protein
MNKTVDRPWIAQAWLDAPIRPAGRLLAAWARCARWRHITVQNRVYRGHAVTAIASIAGMMLRCGE